MGDPEVVHNEYMQMLTDYGALGLVVLMLFLAVSLISGLVGPRRERGSENSLQAGLRLGAIGGLAGGMAHAAIDFQPHLLPILMMAGMLVGVLLQSSGSSGWFRKGLQVCATLLALIFAVVAVAPESRATGAWLGWERKVIESPLGIDPGELPSLKRLVESSPHYSGARMYGRLQYRSFVETSELFRLEEARWGLSLALERHPYDPLSLINYSLVLDQLGEFEDALRIHRRAIEMTSGREDKYGAYGGLSQHLALRGQKLWMSREPEKALGCFLLSQQYLELSLRMRYKFGGKADYGARRQALKYAIKTLQDGKIQPEFPQDIKEPNSSRLD
jgi:tetratricopeptide (TPR) repeat protein